jgi:hypothetical protein
MHAGGWFVTAPKDAQAPYRSKEDTTVFGWIAIGLLYLLSMGLFRLAGGLPAAGEALKRWGEAVARSRHSTSH